MGKSVVVSGLIGIFCLLAACQSNQPEPLYNRLGGDQMVSAIVDDFIARASIDPRVNFTRKGTGAEWNPTPENYEKLRTHLIQFFESGSGGPQGYEGKDMKTAHANMHITSFEFDAIKADMAKSLAKFDTPARETSEVLALMESTRKDIVEGK